MIQILVFAVLLSIRVCWSTSLHQPERPTVLQQVAIGVKVSPGSTKANLSPVISASQAFGSEEAQSPILSQSAEILGDSSTGDSILAISEIESPTDRSNAQSSGTDSTFVESPLSDTNFEFDSDEERVSSSISEEFSGGTFLKQEDYDAITGPIAQILSSLGARWYERGLEEANKGLLAIKGLVREVLDDVNDEMLRLCQEMRNGSTADDSTVKFRELKDLFGMSNAKRGIWSQPDLDSESTDSTDKALLLELALMMDIIYDNCSFFDSVSSSSSVEEPISYTSVSRDSDSHKLESLTDALVHIADIIDKTFLQKSSK